jgi:predicted transcriptional regulator
MTDTPTLYLSAETRAKLDRLGGATNRPPVEIAEAALEAYLDLELSIIADIEDGLAEARAGNLFEHGEVADRVRSALEARLRGS